MPVIALLTDFGSQDAYVAQLKGAVLTVAHDANIVDLMHDVPAHDHKHASYMLAKSSKYFPPGTIFIAVVDPGVGTQRKPVAVRTRADKIYIGPDNGIFSHVIAREGLAEARVLENTTYFWDGNISSTFHGRDIFGPAAAHLARGVPLAELGPPAPALASLDIKAPVVLGDRVTGEVVHIDRYGNILTNMTSSHVEASTEALLNVTLRARTLSMPLLKSYGDAPDQQRPFIILNSDGEVEITRRETPAAQLFRGIQVGDPIVIRK